MKPLYRLTFSALLVAIGVIAGNLLYIPIGVAKIFPVQHIINVLSAVLFGPVYAVGTAFAISLLRNLLGTGSVFAFPGSMIGACLAGLFYLWLKKPVFAAIGEVIGTGLIGSLVSFPIARFILGQNVAATFFVAPFLLATTFGSLIAYILLKIMAVHPEFTRYMRGDGK
ncbi:energy coupling factor transporter S component ThiW [Sporolactobacillus sp. CQH2019]|uniref:energy coupling factor transporter S component ThiW n=1 Tax=Sporolactobacillus sp. CQH2019 TaxID=3023512 RepID=UPI002368218E|nr:energy coupling factor transporter S component ThiW [Sporolactobacillus sp. CQH2019]MDD9148750.1 energy coupling factor transporter S component ThiW [Sporolactobacillus sp. CQH2019]